MKLNIIRADEQNKIALPAETDRLIEAAITETLCMESFDCDCEVSLTFTDNEGIRAMNAEYRGKDAVTDVLSFPMFDPEEEAFSVVEGEPVVLGDIVISLERAKAQAEEYGHSFEREVAFLCVHSVLHLLGYDHERSAQEDALMREKQRTVMHALGLDIQEK